MEGRMLEFYDEKELCGKHMVQKKGKEESDIQGRGK